jgi:hypothetical protein
MKERELEQQLIKALRKRDLEVFHSAREDVPGWPDLEVWGNGWSALIEVKDFDRISSTEPYSNAFEASQFVTYVKLLDKGIKVFILGHRKGELFMHTFMTFSEIFECYSADIDMVFEHLHAVKIESYDSVISLIRG